MLVFLWFVALQQRVECNFKLRKLAVRREQSVYVLELAAAISAITPRPDCATNDHHEAMAASVAAPETIGRSE